MHIRTHTREKPLICEVCLKGFCESSNLSKHRKTHDTPPNRCRFNCDFSCVDKLELRQHYDAHHQVDIEQERVIVAAEVAQAELTWKEAYPNLMFPTTRNKAMRNKKSRKAAARKSPKRPAGARKPVKSRKGKMSD
jgi:hypothetical protein